MLEGLESRGYAPGGGFLSAQGVFYLNIPKNSSTFLSNVLLDNGWEHHCIGDSSHLIKHAIVILRDPVERWISGFATYATSWILGDAYGSDHFVKDFNNLSERLIFDNLVFDDHTTPQHEFVKQLPNVPITYFYLTQDVIKNISAFLDQDIIVNDVFDNKSENHYDQQQITKFIRNRLNNRPDLIERINEKYINDFNLIDNTEFYGSR